MDTWWRQSNQTPSSVMCSEWSVSSVIDKCAFCVWQGVCVVCVLCVGVREQCNLHAFLWHGDTISSRRWQRGWSLIHFVPMFHNSTKMVDLRLYTILINDWKYMCKHTLCLYICVWFNCVMIYMLYWRITIVILSGYFCISKIMTMMTNTFSIFFFWRR